MLGCLGVGEVVVGSKSTLGHAAKEKVVRSRGGLLPVRPSFPFLCGGWRGVSEGSSHSPICISLGQKDGVRQCIQKVEGSVLKGLIA